VDRLEGYEEYGGWRYTVTLWWRYLRGGKTEALEGGSGAQNMSASPTDHLSKQRVVEPGEYAPIAAIRTGREDQYDRGRFLAHSARTFEGSVTSGCINSINREERMPDRSEIN